MGIGSRACSQRTVSSAPSAVFRIPDFGGQAVIPVSRSFSAAAASAVRKNDPTLYMLRTLSNRIATGSESNASYGEASGVARKGSRSIFIRCLLAAVLRLLHHAATIA